jgi:hypothetical protein
MIVRRKMIAIAGSLWLASCGSLPDTKSKKDKGAVADQSARDRDAVDGPVGRVMLRGSSALSLASESEETADDSPKEAPAESQTEKKNEIVIREGLTVTAARLSIALIKLSETKDPTPQEKQQETTANAEENKTEENSVSKLVNLVSQGVGKGKFTPEERAAQQKSIIDLILLFVGMDKSIRFKGPFVFDTVSGKLESSSVQVNLKEGFYRRIGFKLKRNFDVSSSDPLEGNAYVVSGTVTKKDGSKVGFDVEFDGTLNCSLRSDVGFEVKADVDNTLGLFFDVRKWFEGVDLEKADLDRDTGKIQITRRKNRDILRQISGNIQKYTGYYKDAGGTPKPGEILGKGEPVP